MVTTHHQVVVDGRTIRYTARAGLLPLLDNDTGALMARMFFVSYVVDRAANAPPRPLTFLWNGGPGSSSSQVHVVGFGPKRIKTADTYPDWGPTAESALQDNQETWLGTSDLVFVDPVGTGFSRATSDSSRDILYTTRGDVEATAEFIRLYRTRFGAWNAPIYIAGESYGTTRAMGVAEALERRRTHLAGVILISGFFDIGQRVPGDLTQVLQLPLYTATAYYYKRLPPDLLALTRDAAVQQAVQWGRQAYLPAISRRDSLSESEHTAILEGLRRFTGIQPRYVGQRTLAIAKDEFMDELMADRGLELGRYDSRMTAKHRTAQTPWSPLIDPSLVPMIDLMQGTSRTFNSYVRDSLGYRSDLLYRGPFGGAFHPEPLEISPGGFASDWMESMWNRSDRNENRSEPRRDGGTSGGDSDRLAEDQATKPPLRTAMAINPTLRVMNVRGMYDMSCLALDEAVARSDENLRSRITNHCYVGGHMVYTDLAARQQLQRDFAAFVASAGATPHTGRPDTSP